MVWKHLISLTKEGDVINTTVANATVKAFMSKYLYAGSQVDVDSSPWA